MRLVGEGRGPAAFKAMYDGDDDTPGVCLEWDSSKPLDEIAMRCTACDNVTLEGISPCPLNMCCAAQAQARQHQW